MSSVPIEMPRIVRIMRHPGVWEELPECQSCMGQGACLVEEPVPDYRSGNGYVIERLGECPECDGNRYVEWPEEDEPEFFQEAEIDAQSAFK